MLDSALSNFLNKVDRLTPDFKYFETKSPVPGTLSTKQGL